MRIENSKEKKTHCLYCNEASLVNKIKIVRNVKAVV